MLAIKINKLSNMVKTFSLIFFYFCQIGQDGNPLISSSLIVLIAQLYLKRSKSNICTMSLTQTMFDGHSWSGHDVTKITLFGVVTELYSGKALVLTDLVCSYQPS